MAAPSGQVDWARLRAYIATKEAYEQQHGLPAPLSDLEREAIMTLIPQPRPPVQESMSDSTNWLGLLNQYAQVKYLTTRNITFTFESVNLPKAKGFDVAWRCLCTIPGTEASFPCPGYGIEPGETDARLFMKKQDAKQHAAKWACDYLYKNNLMPAGGSFSRPPPLASPSTTLSKRPASPPSLLPTAPAVPSTVQSNAAQPAPLAKKRQATSPASSGNCNGNSSENSTATTASPAPNGREEDKSTAVVQVNALARALGVPLPRYVLTEHREMTDFWSVRVDFHDSPLFPPNLGSVHEVYTKKAAKEKSAELVKVWMEGIRFQRDQARREILQREKMAREVEVRVS
ncbi:hypothetical protein ACRALDRAFT_2044326 [Sodiomyces alcalophilus JCM 7366]|uniref:uncharacterized protein n=1 Tax=Sodiomyces alcalophilus JCM 7366 TaxID=591952 RepID=UPI0039B39B9B